MVESSYRPIISQKSKSSRFSQRKLLQIWQTRIVLWYSPPFPPRHARFSPIVSPCCRKLWNEIVGAHHCHHPKKGHKDWSVIVYLLPGINQSHCRLGMPLVLFGRGHHHLACLLFANLVRWYRPSVVVMFFWRTLGPIWKKTIHHSNQKHQISLNDTIVLEARRSSCVPVCCLYHSMHKDPGMMIFHHHISRFLRCFDHGGNTSFWIQRYFSSASLALIKSSSYIWNVVLIIIIILPSNHDLSSRRKKRSIVFQVIVAFSVFWRYKESSVFHHKISCHFDTATGSLSKVWRGSDLAGFFVKLFPLSISSWGPTSTVMTVMT